MIDIKTSDSRVEPSSPPGKKSKGGSIGGIFRKMEENGRTMGNSSRRGSVRTDKSRGENDRKEKSRRDSLRNDKTKKESSRNNKMRRGDSIRNEKPRRDSLRSEKPKRESIKSEKSRRDLTRSMKRDASPRHTSGNCDDKSESCSDDLFGLFQSESAGDNMRRNSFLTALIPAYGGAGGVRRPIKNCKALDTLLGTQEERESEVDSELESELELEELIEEISQNRNASAVMVRETCVTGHYKRNCKSLDSLLATDDEQESGRDSEIEIEDLVEQRNLSRNTNLSSAEKNMSESKNFSIRDLFQKMEAEGREYEKNEKLKRYRTRVLWSGATLDEKEYEKLKCAQSSRF